MVRNNVHYKRKLNEPLPNGIAMILPTASPANATTAASAAPSQAGFPGWWDPANLARLERFALAFRRGSEHTGEFRSVRRGGQMEFLEHRPYAIGDDLKFLDWNVYGRLQTLFVKTYTAERGSTATILVDASASMHVPLTSDGQPAAAAKAAKKSRSPRQPATRFEAALLAASAISYVALLGHHRVRFGIADRAQQQGEAGSEIRFLPERSGSAGFLALMRDLGRLEREESGTEVVGRPPFAPAISRLAAVPRLRGPVFLLSDGYQAAAQRHEVARLAARPDVQVTYVQLLTPAELDPPAADGTVSLIDSETGEELTVPDVPGWKELYRDALGQFVDSWKETCARHSVFHVLADAGTALLDALLAGVHRAGVVT